jgi:hypothetical protein
VNVMKVGDRAWAIEWNGKIEPVIIISVAGNGQVIAKFEKSRFITKDKVFATKLEALEDEALYVIDQQEEFLYKAEMLEATLKELQEQIYGQV